VTPRLRRICGYSQLGKFPCGCPLEVGDRYLASIARWRVANGPDDQSCRRANVVSYFP
jgi:hypothetical protein